jgi:Fe-S-cluster-containing dehydrogenase component
MPVMCQQCTEAPCEPVCPVFATYHNEEGLNAQIYNRCIGTRFCGSACPYKVRIYNWFEPEFPEPLNEQLNPDVSVRTRGIMEKCTFCIQRIRRAEIDAQAGGREPSDGEIQPACVQTCPTIALVFGDLAIQTAKPVAWRSHRSFRLLPELVQIQELFTSREVKQMPDGTTNQHQENHADVTTDFDSASCWLKKRSEINRQFSNRCPDRKGFLVLVTILGLIVAWGLYAWGYLIYWGIGVTGKNRPVYWTLFITTFVFWVGISHAGTMISAVLRLLKADWRRPITRGAEAMTAFALMMAGLYPLIHLGRVWKFYWMIPYPNNRFMWPNFQSPLMWDMIAIFTYLIGSLLYLYLALIPDMAMARDHTGSWRFKLYRILALGWRGTEGEWHKLHRALGIFSVAIIPIFLSVHSIVSWDFAVTIQPRWHSTIFAPYFVIGAVYSGLCVGKHLGSRAARYAP